MNRLVIQPKITEKVKLHAKPNQTMQYSIFSIRSERFRSFKTMCIRRNKQPLAKTSTMESHAQDIRSAEDRKTQGMNWDDYIVDRGEAG